MFSDIGAVLFDLDGTLIDSAPDLGAAADKMRVARGLPSLPLELYRPMAGAGARGMLGVAFGMAPDHPDFAALRRAVIYGSVLASFNVEAFSLERLRTLTRDEITARYEVFRAMSAFEATE